MSDFVAYKFEDTPRFAEAFDEAPLWSARFGFFLLDNIELKSNITALDIGSGSGFPLIQLAEILGRSSKVYGIDPWVNANNRAKDKIREYGISNIKIYEQSAETIPFDDNSINLIVANLGINNFEDPNTVIKECFRVLKDGGKLSITTNLEGHWKDFYTIFESTLIQLNKASYIEVLKKEQEHRGSVESISNLFLNNGFRISKSITDSFSMKFVDGSAFLNHHFVKCGWLTSWFELFPEHEKEHIFSTLEKNLNIFAQEQGCLKLTVPMLFVEGSK